MDISISSQKVYNVDGALFGNKFDAVTSAKRRAIMHVIDKANKVSSVDKHDISVLINLGSDLLNQCAEAIIDAQDQTDMIFGKLTGD